MSIFLVVPTVTREELAPMLESLQGNGQLRFLALPKGEYLVSFKGTSQELSDILGISNGSKGAGIVAAVSSYYGFATNNIWEWMSAHWEN